MSVTCRQCSGRAITCDQCGRSYPMTEEGPTSVGNFHGGNCPDHGPIYAKCHALIATPADPILKGIKERAEHFNKSVTTAAVISLFFGFLLGAAVALAVASFYVSKYCSLAS